MGPKNHENLILALIVGLIVMVALTHWFASTFQPREFENALSGGALVVLLVLYIYSRNSPLKPPGKK